jgi:hypothetical protein
MADETKKEEPEQLEQVVETLEQILEVMPEDYVTLHTLYETFVKLQQPRKAFEYLARLADFVTHSQNEEGVSFVLQQYEAIGDLGPEVEARKAQLRVLQAELAGETADSISKDTAEVSVSQNIEAEMALAWDLFQEEQLTQEEYSNVLHDLTEMSSRSVDVPITVLHVLHDRQFSRFERLMTYLCNKSGVPIILLSSYEENEELNDALPLDFLTQRGVLPFASIGDDLLVAVLNPCDKTLVRDAEQAAEKRCHPYLVSPEEYDRRLAQIKKALEG